MKKRTLKRIVGWSLAAIGYVGFFWCYPLLTHLLPYLVTVLLMHGLVIGLLAMGIGLNFLIKWIQSPD